MPPVERERLAADVTALVEPLGASRSRSRTPAASSGAACADRSGGGRVAGATCPGAHPRSLGGAGVRGHGPADAGRPRRRAVAPVPRPVPHPCGAGRRRPRRGRPRVERSRLQPPGPEPAPMRRGRWSPTTAVPSPLTWRSSSPCPASAPTRPAPCWPSPSSTTTASSTPTRPASWPAGAVARLRATEAQAAADAAVPPGGAWAWNQAMLDLGATVCRRRATALR